MPSPKRLGISSARVKPFFSRTRVEPMLSFATNAKSGRDMSSVKNSRSAADAIPLPQYSFPKNIPRSGDCSLRSC